MIQLHHREKMINAVIYFGANTQHCGIVKLFKLLYFLDFEHFKQTGRSVTGLDYFAWRMGPVPVELYDEVEVPETDLALNVAFESHPTKYENNIRLVRPKAGFDPTHFSNRELNLLKQLATEYRDTPAKDMIEATHVESSPWHQIYEVEKRFNAPIPYEAALMGSTPDEILEVAQEHKEMLANYR